MEPRLWMTRLRPGMCCARLVSEMPQWLHAAMHEITADIDQCPEASALPKSGSFVMCTEVGEIYAAKSSMSTRSHLHKTEEQR
jgi:hypothetical protein